MSFVKQLVCLQFSKKWLGIPISFYNSETVLDIIKTFLRRQSYRWNEEIESDTINTLNVLAAMLLLFWSAFDKIILSLDW